MPSIYLPKKPRDYRSREGVQETYDDLVAWDAGLKKDKSLNWLRLFLSKKVRLNTKKEREVAKFDRDDTVRRLRFLVQKMDYEKKKILIENRQSGKTKKLRYSTVEIMEKLDEIKELLVKKRKK